MDSLNSPGVAVDIIDESSYAPAAPGTVPLIFVATAENKLDSSGTTIAPGTLKKNAGKVYLLSGQRDLYTNFGAPKFQYTVENTPINASEQNEYGINAALSYLGVSNRAFVARADIDLNQLSPLDAAPRSYPEDGVYWLDSNASFYGIFEWNGSPVTSNGGQSYTNKVPLVINDVSQLANFAAGDYSPKASLGKPGTYAIVTATTNNDLYFFNSDNEWVIVGSNKWSASWPTVSGTRAVNTLNAGDNFYINGISITAGTTIDSLVTDINAKNINNGAITAKNVNNKLVLFNNGSYDTHAGDSTTGDGISISAGTVGSLVNNNIANSVLGIAPGFYYNPKLTISKHTQVPLYRTESSNPTPRPTGSVWIKTTNPNFGANWRVKRFKASTKTWETLPAPLYPNAQSALYGLDKAGGGLNIPLGDVYINYNFDEAKGLDSTPLEANFKLMRRNGIGETVITSKPVTASTLRASSGNGGMVLTFTIAESLAGTEVLGDYNKVGAYLSKPISVVSSGTISDSEAVVFGINTAGLVNISAEVDSLNRVVIKHKLGGDFRLADGADGILNKLGFVAYDMVTKTGTTNLYNAPIGDTTSDYVASLWMPLTYVHTSKAPTSLTNDGTLWYNKTLSDVDIMINDGNHWVGYKSQTSPFYSFFDQNKTDPNGPIISAMIPPVTQTDGSPLVTGDLWIDSSDIENYPKIYKFNAEFENKPIKDRWVLVDNSDQTHEDGIVFADARYNISGELSETPGTIVDLLTSDFVDFDAPDPALYPRGMLLWNLRRSGNNVKKFHQNYVDLTAENARFGAAPLYHGETMTNYYPHRWVTVSGNNDDGSGCFGRHAQRRVVVNSFVDLINNNQSIRDEEGVVFNLMACPGYPEVLNDLAKLNIDRGETAFVIGDTPARLTSDSTSLLNWGNNVKLSGDNDQGAATYDPYVAMFYPWGQTTDKLVVPPSHMMLTTFAISDSKSYPWFAPAGTNRGNIKNAGSVGFVDSEGEFKAVALNKGQRDTLYDIKVNPITFFEGSGLVNYGQKTRAPEPTAIDRINVARLIAYLRRRLGVLAKPFIFEPNDRTTRNELKHVIESVMLELVGSRAITDYLVVVDESNNTPARIDRNELYADVAIVPVKSVEFLYIPIRLKNTGASLTGV